MKFSHAVGSFRLDRALIAILVLASMAVAARAWLSEHPEHNPWAPLELDHPPGWATERKLASLRSDPTECRAVLERSGIEFVELDPIGDGECRRDDRLALPNASIRPARPEMTCAQAAAFEYWMIHGVQPAAQELLESPVAQIQHFGTFSCRRLYGRETGPWSEHATANAIDISGFVLEDGRRISVLSDWKNEGEEAAFLRAARDAACNSFATVLSPDYNDAHADHLHLDQQHRNWGVCR